MKYEPPSALPPSANKMKMLKILFVLSESSLISFIRFFFFTLALQCAYPATRPCGTRRFCVLLKLWRPLNFLSIIAYCSELSYISIATFFRHLSFQVTKKRWPKNVMAEIYAAMLCRWTQRIINHTR